jgi:cell division protein FtsN
MSISESKRLHPDRSPSVGCPLARSLLRNMPLLYAASLCLILVLGCAAGCFFHKKQEAAVPKAIPGPVRVVLLPFNIPADATDLRWVALAIPIMLAKAMSAAPDLELAPIWESVPIARDLLGASRTISEEMAAHTASRLSARWAAQGKISKSKNGYALILDFIPAKAASVPFRYEKETSMDSMMANFPDAIEQFSRYQELHPLKKQEAQSNQTLPWKEIAEALDREYGWFVTARLFFNPSYYPILGGRKETKLAVSVAPAAPVPEKPNPQPAPAAAIQAERSVPGPVPPPSRTEPAKPPPAAPASRVINTVPELRPPPIDVAFAPPAVIRTPEDGTVAVPPPKSFTQKLNPSPYPTSQKGPSQPITAKAESSLAMAAAKPPATTPPAPAKSESESIRPSGKAPSSAALKSFRIQVYATKNNEEAQSISSKLSSAGFAPEIEKADLGDKGIWYRIRLQGFTTREAARAAGNKLVGESVIKEFWLLP